MDWSSLSLADKEINLTALVEIPALTSKEMKSAVDIRMPEIPNPTGPRRRAITFDLIKAIIILKT